MQESSTSTYNETACHPQLSLWDSFLSSFMFCIVSRPTSIVFILYLIITVCLHLPLSLFILYYGLKQWILRSTSSAAPMSRSDCFTYHLASMELIGVTGYILTLCAIYKEDALGLLAVGTRMFTFTWFGEIFFHVVTCLERYLAVVHPIRYLNLRKRSRIRIRNIIMYCFWLLTLLLINLTTGQIFFIFHFCALVLSVVVVSFCNLSVLNVLLRPRLGEQAGGSERADQSKKRAFYTTMAILGALLLRFAFDICWATLHASKYSDCVTMTIDGWFNLPSNLVLQFLFLHKTDNFLCKRKFQ